MAISTLAIGFTEIQKRLLKYVHGSRSYSGTTDETDQIDEVMKSGYRRFLDEHDWSFLQPKFRLPIQSGVDTYEMSPEFGGVVGSLTYEDSDDIFVSVTKVDYGQISTWRSSQIVDTSWPKFFSESPGRVLVDSGQLWEIDLWPSPDGDYTLVGRQRLNVEAMSSTLVYPAGATEHAEAILMACLAQAEAQYDGEPGVYEGQYQMAVQKSLRKEATNHTPETLGYNGDGPNEYPYTRENLWYLQNNNSLEIS